MPYRDSLKPDASTRAPITGPDDNSTSGVWFGALFVVLAALAVASHRGRVYFALAMAAVAALWRIDARTRRFAATIVGDVIVLRSRAFGWLTVRTRRFDLACSLYVSDVRDEYDDVGLFFVLPVYATAHEGAWVDGNFGSATHREANRRAFEALREAIDEARRARAALDIDRHLDPALGELAVYWPAIDPDSITRNAYGRVQSAVTRAELTHDELGPIPVGSTLRFVPDDHFRARATRDELTAVEFSAPSARLAAKANLDDPATPSLAGATVKLFRFRRMNSSFSRRVLVFERAFAAATVAGRAIRGGAPIETDDGAVSRCTLEDPIEIAGRTYESGAEIAFNGARQCMLTAQHAVEFRGRVIAAPAHVHFALKDPRASMLLRDILREPDAWLAAPTQAHTIAQAPQGASSSSSAP